MKENRRALLDNLGELFPCTLCSTAWFPPHYWRISHCQAIAIPSRLYFTIMASLPLHLDPHKIVFSLMCVQTVNSMHGSQDPFVLVLIKSCPIGECGKELVPISTSLQPKEISVSYLYSVSLTVLALEKDVSVFFTSRCSDTSLCTVTTICLPEKFSQKQFFCSDIFLVHINWSCDRPYTDLPDFTR